MKYISILFLFVFLACQDKDETVNSNTGYLRLNIGTNLSVSTKADEVYDGKQIAVKILNSEGAIVKQTDDWETWNGDNFELPAGEYTIKASSNGFDGKTAAFNKPYYAGNKTVVIEKGKTVNAEIVCSLANVKVSVSFSESFRKAFKAGTVQIGSAEEGATYLSFLMSDDLKGKYAYFPAKPLAWSITVKNKNDVSKTMKDTIETVEMRDYFKFNFTIASSSNITISVDGTTKDYNYTVGIPISLPEFKLTTDKVINTWTKSAKISGQVFSQADINQELIQFKYRKATEEVWKTVKATVTNTAKSTYTAVADISELTPATMYEYMLSYDDGILANSGEILSFTTGAIIPLTNGSFDDWYSSGKLWNPWLNDGTSFWDTGNRGATTISDSNSTPSDNTYKGSGKAAQLESKYIVIKFAAGNIFTGSYIKTDGTNGVLSFGREFNSFPTKLRIHYKYTSKTIDKCNDNAYAYLKGQPDSCHIYIALTDWDQPLEIRTKPATRQLFDKNDQKVIAYAEFISGTSTDTYQELDLPLEYRYSGRTPKYIVVVASASKYGDYFTGGAGSTLLVDDFELLYEK